MNISKKQIPALGNPYLQFKIARPLMTLPPITGFINKSRNLGTGFTRFCGIFYQKLNNNEQKYNKKMNISKKQIPTLGNPYLQFKIAR